MTVRARIARAAAIGCAAATIAGMAACGTTMKGRAITGSAGIVTVVPDDGAHDERQGVEGVEVVMRTVGGAIIGTTTSKADGRFTLKLSNDRASGRVQVTADREGYPVQRGTVTFPGPRHLLLVIFPERDGAGVQGQADDSRGR